MTDSERLKYRSACNFAMALSLAVAVAAAFWGVSIRAAELGEEAARRIADGTFPRPSAIVYSQKDLSIAGAEDVGYEPSDRRVWAYKYRGYRVLTYANNRWFLVWSQWTPTSPTVILPDDGSIRVEVIPPPGTEPPAS